MLCTVAWTDLQHGMCGINDQSEGASTQMTRTFPAHARSHEFFFKIHCRRRGFCRGNEPLQRPDGDARHPQICHRIPWPTQNPFHQSLTLVWLRSVAIQSHRPSQLINWCECDRAYSVMWASVIMHWSKAQRAHKRRHVKVDFPL